MCCSLDITPICLAVCGSCWIGYLNVSWAVDTLDIELCQWSVTDYEPHCRPVSSSDKAWRWPVICAWRWRWCRLLAGEHSSFSICKMNYTNHLVAEEWYSFKRETVNAGQICRRAVNWYSLLSLLKLFVMWTGACGLAVEEAWHQWDQSEIFLMLVKCWPRHWNRWMDFWQVCYNAS